MENIIMDYIWVDGQEPQRLKSKTRILHVDMRRYPDVQTYMGSTPRLLTFSDLEKIPVWKDRTNVLRPVKLYKHTDRYIVLCEVCDDNKPLSTEYRAELNCLCSKSPKTPLTIRQEFVIDNNKIWNKDDSYYCSVDAYGSEIVEEFIKTCLDLSIIVDDVNSEEMFGQWTYRLSSGDVLSISDDLLVSRFMLHKICNRKKESVFFNSLYVDYKDKTLEYNDENNPYKFMTELFKG